MTSAEAWLRLPWAALAVALPLAAALLAMLSGRVGRALCIPVALAGLVVAAAAAWQLARLGPQQILLGGWPPPLGIAWRLDGLACAFVAATALVGAGALLFARAALARQAPVSARAGSAFWPLAFCLLAALNAAFLGSDLFNLYVALELLTVCAVALVAIEGKGEALAAAMRYLLFALLGSLAYLLGAALLYAEHATLDLQRLGAQPPGASGALAAGLMTAGLMAKAALFPLHGWLPSAHAAAPAAASALLSALVVKAPLVILLRLWFQAWPALATPAFVQGMAVLGAFGVVLASLLALRQQRLKLLIAWSTVAQLGYLLVALPLATGPSAQSGWAGTAWSGAVLHALAHALAKSAMFLAAGAMVQALGHDRLKGLAGLGQHLPLASFAFGIAAVSLMGLPPSAGFLAKYMLLTAAVAAAQWWWAVLVIAGGLLAAAYLFRPLALLLAKGRPPRRLAPVGRGRQAIALALALASVLLGLFSLEPMRLLQEGHAP